VRKKEVKNFKGENKRYKNGTIGHKITKAISLSFRKWLLFLYIGKKYRFR
jgi:hypothetical protein